jgi:hypothetical protein
MSIEVMKIEGLEDLRKDLVRLGAKRGNMGSVVRKAARTVVAQQMQPVFDEIWTRVPVHSGRLRASIGKLAVSKASTSKFMIGTTGGFSFTNIRSNKKMFQGKGKKQDSYLNKGYQLDKTSPNLYAGGVEFGTKKSGAVARKAGGAYFLNETMLRHRARMLSTIVASFQRAIDQAVKK